MPKLLVAAAFMMLFTGEISSHRSGQAGDAAEEIRMHTREFVAGFNSGNVDRIISICGERFVAANLTNPIQTRSQRGDYYRHLVEHHATEVEVTPAEIIVDGNHATVRGTTLVFKLDASGKRGKATEYRYLELWERQSSGWKSIWIMNVEPDPS